jgi:diaminopropionate ammonia-lyase
LEALSEPPTHVFIQAGVGGLAAAVAGHMAMMFGGKRATFVVVEPARAACVFESARAGQLVQVARGKPTAMAMLECYEPSLVAWRVLSRAADAFLTVADDEAAAALKLLARSSRTDPSMRATESGAAGLAGLTCVARDTRERLAIGLNASSRAFVVNTEGASTRPVLPSSESAPR